MKPLAGGHEDGKQWDGGLDEDMTFYDRLPRAQETLVREGNKGDVITELANQLEQEPLMDAS